MESWTDEDRDLLKRLSPPPKCMHNPALIEELKDPPRWKCGECGRIILKNITWT